MRRGLCIDCRPYVDDSGRRRTIPRLQPFLPPFVQSHYQTNYTDTGRTSLKNFEDLSLETRRAFKNIFSDCHIRPNRMPKLAPDDLLAALAEAAREVESVERAADADPATGGDHSLARLRLRGGLQVIGAHIVETNRPAHSRAIDHPLRLVNARLPFSLRLIGCIIEAPLALNSLQLVTLDLSGSAMTGLDATFLAASGSVRLRRSFIAAPADFGGAKIGGFFDASDVVIKPLGQLPSSQAFSADRGALNVSQANIDNDITLNRARIWGGIAMRGLVAKRSLFLDEAIILSPVACLEFIAAEVASSADKAHPAVQLLCDRAGAERRLARKTRGLGPLDHPGWELGPDFVKPPGAQSGLALLAEQSVRARTSAIRADGAAISGSIFARDAETHGRLRLKYATIGGSLSLDGALLRSAESIRATFDALACAIPPVGPGISEIARYRAASWNVAKRLELSENDSFALDLREARFGGSVRINILSKDDTTPGVVGSGQTRIQGQLAAERIRIDGKLLVERVSFVRVVRPQTPTTDGAAVDLSNATINDDVSFKGCDGLHGLALRNADLGGDLLFADETEAPMLQRIPSPNRASNLGGIFDLSSAQVAGDCRLLFAENPGGPSIVAEFAQFGGYLEILPLPETGATDDFNLAPALFQAQVDAANTEWRNWEIAANDTTAALHRRRVDERVWPKIDLRNASAKVFSHPSAAWPRAGRLKIVGFRYDRTGPYGPLAPHPFTGDARIRAGDAWRRPAWFAAGELFFAGAAAIAASIPASPFAAAGVNNLILAALFCALGAAYVGLPALSSPFSDQSRPMAISWLNLQTLDRNRHRSSESLISWWRRRGGPGVRYGNIYHSLEPYGHAAKALRENGLWLSANALEQRRLQVRTGQLSWRSHGFAKLGFRTLDILAHYGFNFVRLGFGTAALVLVTAMAANVAMTTGTLIPRAEDAGDAWRLPLRQSPVAFDTALPAAMPSIAVGPLLREPMPLGFAADTILPVLGLKEAERWHNAPRDGSWRDWTVRAVIDVARLLGLGVVGLLLLGIGARLSTVLGRYAD